VAACEDKYEKRLQIVTRPQQSSSGKSGGGSRAAEAAAAAAAAVAEAEAEALSAAVEAAAEVRERHVAALFRPPPALAASSPPPPAPHVQRPRPISSRRLLVCAELHQRLHHCHVPLLCRKRVGLPLTHPPHPQARDDAVFRLGVVQEEAVRLRDENRKLRQSKGSNSSQRSTNNTRAAEEAAVAEAEAEALSAAVEAAAEVRERHATRGTLCPPPALAAASPHQQQTPLGLCRAPPAPSPLPRTPAKQSTSVFHLTHPPHPQARDDAVFELSRVQAEATRLRGENEALREQVAQPTLQVNSRTHVTILCTTKQRVR
jgi:hypothetical protein